MSSTQELTRRIKSIKSTRKVTRAMQMVSASKMRKSQVANLASRTYTELALELVRSLHFAPPEEEIEAEPYIDSDTEAGLQNLAMMRAVTLLGPAPAATKIAVLIVSTNRGLVGGFNTNLFSKVKELEQQYGKENIDYIIIGKKAAEFAARVRKNIVADFVKLDTLPTPDYIYGVAQLLTKRFTEGEYRAVFAVYNHFVSTLAQQPRAKQLLPLEVGTADAVYAAGVSHDEYILEPDPHTVITHLLPRILESQLYQVMLESDASEYSARMVMMKNATESAGDLIADLTLTFNQLRQNKITTELSEITAGKIALEGQ